MKCPVCGTVIANNSPKCPKCNRVFNENVEVPVYSGKTKSKTLAGILMLFGIGDLYLLTFGRFFLKMFLLFVTLGFGTAALQIIDAIRVFNGKINCDANGVPLV